MRKTRNPALALLVVAAVLAMACKTTSSGTPATGDPPNVTALKILNLTRVTVAAGVAGFNAFVATGKVPEATRLKVIQLREQYLAADKVAMTGLTVSTITDPGMYVAAVTGFAHDLLAFINSLLPPTSQVPSVAGPNGG